MNRGFYTLLVAQFFWFRPDCKPVFNAENPLAGLCFVGGRLAGRFVLIAQQACPELVEVVALLQQRFQPNGQSVFNALRALASAERAEI